MREIAALRTAMMDLDTCWEQQTDHVNVGASRILREIRDSSKLFQAIEDGDLAHLNEVTSPATDALLRVLDEVVPTLTAERDRVMIFTTTRRGARLLVDIITQHFGQRQAAAQTFQPRVSCIVGHGPGSASSLDHGMTSAEQVERSREFKDGVFNILVSTSVCKEGIDVGDCSVGIEHGDIVSQTALCQFIGRVRADHGRVYVIGDGQDSEDFNQMLERREQFREAIMQAYLKVGASFPPHPHGYIALAFVLDCPTACGDSPAALHGRGRSLGAERLVEASSGVVRSPGP
jgi:ERCC4-related helicase